MRKDAIEEFMLLPLGRYNLQQSVLSQEIGKVSRSMKKMSKLRKFWMTMWL